MKRIDLLTLTLSLTTPILFASPTELTFKAKIVSLKDSKTKMSSVRHGGKVQTQLKVFVIAKGIAEEDNKEWLSKSLPKSVKGYIENHETATGETYRYVNLNFQLQPNTIYCAPGENPRFEYCKAEYTLPAGNTLNIPAGKGGIHSIKLEVLPTVSLAKLEYTKSSPQTYNVVEPERQLSYIRFKK